VRAFQRSPLATHSLVVHSELSSPPLQLKAKETASLLPTRGGEGGGGGASKAIALSDRSRSNRDLVATDRECRRNSATGSAQVGEREGEGEDMCEKVRCPCWPASKGLSINAPTKALVKAGGARVRRDFRGYRARARAKSGSRLAFILISNAGNGITPVRVDLKRKLQLQTAAARGLALRARVARARVPARAFNNRVTSAERKGYARGGGGREKGGHQATVIY